MIKKKTNKIIGQVIHSAVTRTFFLGGGIYFWEGQNFWIGILFSKFSVDLKKKKNHRANFV